jgi:acyl carrier protein
MTSGTQSEVLETVAGLIREVVREAWIQELPIGPETSFADDIQIKSIELVGLAEKLQERYGSRVDFIGWLAGLAPEEMAQLRVGQLVDYVVRR